MKLRQRPLVAALFWVISFQGGLALAAVPREEARFEEAAKAYQTGNFAKAREIYEGLATERKKDPALCYNLGNTYYRLGKTGRAILWYKRALREQPFDAETWDNLILARAGLRGEGENALEKVTGFPGTRRLLWAATLCLWIGATALILHFLKITPEGFKKFGVISLVLWIVFAAWGGALGWDESKPWGIVIAGEIQIRSGPGTGFAVGATAPEGMEALVIDERDGWALVGLPKAGIKGWTEAANVERIE